MSPLYEALCDLAKARDERNAAARPVKVCPMNGTACADSSEESRCSGCANVYLYGEPAPDATMEVMAQTNKEKQEAFRSRMAMLGMREVRGIYLPESLHPVLKEQAQKMLEQYKPEDKKGKDNG